jgi:small subunit ribosomal protein S20
LAHHLQAKKRIRQTATRTLRNRLVRTAARTHIKRVVAAIEAGNVEEARAALDVCSRQIDRAVAKGAYHRKTGSRYISRLTSRVAAMSSGEAAE